MNNVIKILCVSIFIIPAAKAMDPLRQGSGQAVNRNNQLHLAASHGNLELVQDLIKAKANVNHMDCNLIPLELAALGGHSLCVQALIDANADLIIMRHQNHSCVALGAAVLSNSQVICEQLVDALLKLPNKSQKKSIIAVLSCGTKRKKGLFKQCMVPTGITQQIAKYMLEACEQANRDNFVDSVAHQEIMKLDMDYMNNIKKNLLEKYNPKIIKNNPKQSKCSIQ